MGYPNIEDNGNGGLPILPPKKKQPPQVKQTEDDLPILKKKEGIPSVSSGGISQSPITSSSDIQKVFEYLKTPKTETERKQDIKETIESSRPLTQIPKPKQKIVLSKDEITKQALLKLQDQQIFIRNNEDPIGDIAAQIKNQKTEGKIQDPNDPEVQVEHAVTNKQIELLKERLIPNGEHGGEILSKLIGRNPDELTNEDIEKLTPQTLTGQEAKDKYLRLRGVKETFGGGLADDKDKFTNAAIKLQVDRGELQPNDYYLDQTKGKAVFDALNDPDVKYLAGIDPAFGREYRETKAHFPSYHPDYAETLVSQYLSDEFEKRGYNNWFSNIQSQSQADKIIDEAVDNGELSEGYRWLYKERIRPRLTVMNQLIYKSPIKSPGFFDRTMESIQSNFLNTGKTVANLTGIRGLYKTDEDIKAQEINKPFEQAEVHPTGVHKISALTGDFAGFILNQVLFGKGMQATKIFNSAESANAVAMGLQIAGDYQDRSKILTDNKALQQLYAGTMTALNMVGAKFLPGQNIGRLLHKEEPSILTALSDMAENKITTEATKNKIIEQFTDFLKNTAKGSLKSGEFMGAVSGIDDVLSQLLQGRGVDLAHSAQAAWSGAEVGLLGGLPIAGFEAAMTRNKPVGKVINKLIADPEGTMALIEQEAQRNPEFAKIKKNVIDNLNYLSGVKSHLDRETDVTQKLKDKYVLLAASEKMLSNKLEITQEPSIKKTIQDKIKRIQEIKNGILNNVPEERILENEATAVIKKAYNDNLLPKKDRELLESKASAEAESKFDEAKVKKYLETIAGMEDQSKYPKNIVELANEMFPAEEPTIEKHGKYARVIMPKEVKQSQKEIVPLKESTQPQPEQQSLGGSEKNIASEKEAIAKWLDESEHNDYVSFDWDGNVLEIFKGRDEHPIELSREELKMEGVDFSADKEIKQQPKTTEQRKESIIKRAAEIEPENLRSAAEKTLHYFATGGKIHPSSIKEIFGSASKSAEGEKRARIGMIRKDAPTVDQLAHQLWENAERPEHITTEDFKDAIETIVKNHNSNGSAARELIGLHEAVRNELTEDEANYIDDVLTKKIEKIVDGLPEDHKNQLINLLKKYQDEYGFIDWERLEKDTNGFDPDILSLPEEVQSSLYGLVEKNLQSGQGELSNAPSESPRKEEIKQEEIVPPTSEEPVPPPREGGDNLMGITHEATQATTRKAGLPDYEGHEPVTHDERIAAAKEAIATNPNIANEIIAKVEKGGNITPQDNAVLAVYKKALDTELEIKPSKELFDRISRLAKVLNPEGTYAGQLLESRKLIDPNEENLSNFLLTKEASQGASLTDKQIKTETEKYQELKKAKDELQEQLDKEREQHAKDLAQLGINKAKAKASKAHKKTHDEYVAERKTSIDAAREALKNIREQPQAAAIPAIRELIAIAPHVKEYVRSLVNEGVDKLDNIITDAHAKFKDVLDGLSKRNVLDIMAGDYDNIKEQTKNQKTNQIRLLQREAKLLKELDAARRGGETAKTEIKKTEISRRIQELQQKIKEVKRLRGKQEEVPTESELLSKYIEKLTAKAKKLAEDIRTKKYLEEKGPEPSFAKSRKAQILEDRVIDLENKIRHERSVDEYNKRGKLRKAFDKVMEILGIRRLVQSAVDISVPLRQGATLISPRRIDIWLKAFNANLKSVFSPKRFERIMYEIRRDPMYHDMIKDRVVFNDLGSADPNLHNEDFRKSFIYKIPVISEPLKASNRSADAFLNVARYEMYKKMRATLERKGLTRESDPKAFQFIGNWAMSMTGRGRMTKMLENSVAHTVLGNTFYGARLMASRFNLLNPLTYFDPRVPRAAKMEAMKDMASFVVTTMAIGTALAYTTGARISLNPDDSDFLELRYGNKVYDISGGLANYIRTFLRIIKAGYTKASGTKYEGKKATENAGKSALNFFRNKLSPNTSYAVDAFFGRAYGQEFDPYDVVKIYPMYTDDALKALKEDGTMALATVLLPNILGIGYGSYASKGQIDATLSDLEKRNLRSDEMNNENIINYNEGGRKITEGEFDEFAKKRDAEIKIGLTQLYNKGMKMVDDNYDIKYKPYKELTKDEVIRETNKIKAAATTKIKKELFGEKPELTEEEKLKKQILEEDNQ